VRWSAPTSIEEAVLREIDAAEPTARKQPKS